MRGISYLAFGALAYCRSVDRAFSSLSVAVRHCYVTHQPSVSGSSLRLDASTLS